MAKVGCWWHQNRPINWQEHCTNSSPTGQWQSADGQARGQASIAPIAAPELLALITDAIQRTYKEAGAGLSPLDLGRLSGEKYNDLLADGVEPDEWRGAVKVMAGQLRKEIAATSTDISNRKREAS